MKCPDCDYENPTGTRLCQGCGAALAPHAEPSEREVVTCPLSESNVALAPVPEGTLLHDGRYAVVEIRAANEQINIYLAEDNAPLRLCPNCQTRASDPQSQSCSCCGADLSDVEPRRPRYLVRESASEHAFRSEAQLLEMGLEHDALLLPRDVFIASPYGAARHYLVEPAFLPPLASSLPIPQELSQVLEWGTSLAQAMDYLHRHRVILQEVTLNHIAIAGRKAYWTHLSRTKIITPAAHSSSKTDLSRDVRDLAAELLYLATGQRQAFHASLPESVATVFSQALTGGSLPTAADFAAALEAARQKLRRPDSATLVVGHRTDVGEERPLNEDSLLALGISAVFRSVNAPVGLFAVADGMGGHEAGDVASRLAIQTIAQQATSDVLLPASIGEPLPDPRQWLTVAMSTANRAVYDQRQTAASDMGTTLVMALVDGDTATIANVGDSRAYLLTPPGIVQVTTDHSLVERLVAAGHIRPEEATSHPQRNIIYRVIGEKSWVDVDVFQQHLAPGEALLLCSDGLSSMVPDEQMWQIWRTSSSPQHACDRLVKAANLAGGEDNITVVVVQVAR